jgi:DNA repair protein RecO (recombination protein O)
VRSPSEISQALLLRSVDYGDADRVVTLLTQRFGKRAFIARAARRSKKRFGSALQPLALLSVQIARGRGALDVLQRAEVVRPFPRLLRDLGRMQAGFSALELLRELSPEQEPDAAVFATAVALLGALDAAQGDEPERLLLCFEARLLALCGLSPRLDRCGLCGKPAEPARSGLFDPRLGHLVCRACGGASHRLASATRLALMRAAGPDFIAVAQGEWSGGELGPARAALRDFIEQRIGRPLRTPSMLFTRVEPR